MEAPLGAPEPAPTEGNIKLPIQQPEPTKDKFAPHGAKSTPAVPAKQVFATDGNDA